MTVNDLVTDVLRQLVVISEIETPSAEQGQDAVTKLNDLMASLAEDGIDLGWNPKATTGDTMALPDGHVATVKAMLGTRLAEGYGLAIPPLMAALADAGYKRMLRTAIYSSARKTCADAPAGENSGRVFNILTGV